MSAVQGRLRFMLETVAKALGQDLCGRFVFVGGSTTALFLTDRVTLEDVRMTDDVDLIIALAGYGRWAQLREQLRTLGFVEHPDDDVICRMRLGHFKVDFMPDDAAILGFTNRWYAQGIQSAQTYTLNPGIDIKMLRPELFIATKLDAFFDRGGADLMASHDLEDILLLVDGRPELVAEIEHCEDDIRHYISEQFQALQKHPDFENFLNGNIRGPTGRVAFVRARFAKIGAC
jgi:predicted nucleotidyltransferase